MCDTVTNSAMDQGDYWTQGLQVAVESWAQVKPEAVSRVHYEYEIMHINKIDPKKLKFDEKNSSYHQDTDRGRTDEQGESSIPPPP